MVSWRWLIASGFISLSISGCFGEKSPPPPPPVSTPPAPKSTAELHAEIAPSVALITSEKGGHGTGFFVEADTGVCTVVTAAHVVANSDSVKVTPDDRKLFSANNVLATAQYRFSCSDI